MHYRFFLRPTTTVSRLRAILLLATLGLGFASLADSPTMSADASDAAADLDVASDPNAFRDWSVQLGVAVITESRIGGMILGDINSADGNSGGQLYSLGVNWTAHRFEIPFHERILRPQFEPYVRLTLVDENGSSTFPDYNAGGGFRWVDFPWNRWIKTTFFMGVGLSYSSQVYAVDREKHPGKERSHLKFDWPIQFTFALPRWPQHQLLLFNDHQSGGHIFDEGGVNSIGIGYQFQF